MRETSPELYEVTVDEPLTMQLMRVTRSRVVSGVLYLTALLCLVIGSALVSTMGGELPT